MGAKQKAPDQNAEPKKKRRVTFSAIDDGVEPEDCLKIYLVSRKEEVGTLEGFCIEHAELGHFFEGGKIYGHRELKITVWVSLISFHAYADITYDSTFDGGKGITDLKAALQRMFAETLVEDKDDFLQTFAIESDYVRSVVSNGEIIHQEASNKCNHDSSTPAEKGHSNLEAIRMTLGNKQAGQLYSRLAPLVLLFVEGSNPIDVTDSSWEMILLVKKEMDQSNAKYILLGFLAVYRFFHYPDTSRLRLSQILVLPPYQHKGHGRYLLEILNNVAVSENVYDLTVEEPLDYFQHVRTSVDTLRLLSCNPIREAVSSAVSRLKSRKLSRGTQKSSFLPPPSAVDEVRRNLKMNKKQFRECWDVLLYLGLDPIEKHLENFVSFVSDSMKADILERNMGKKVVETPSDHDPEASFVMFRSPACEAITAGGDEDEADREGQLKQYVDEKVNKIKLIAQKISLQRS